MMTRNRTARWSMFIMAVALAVPMATAVLAAGDSQRRTVDADGNYFVNDFEDNIPMTEAETTDGKSIVVEGEGEWVFRLAFVSTNTSYVKSGRQNLRLKKNGSYVVTPVLDKGVRQVQFNCGRKGGGVDVYTSADGGKTWGKVTTVNATGIATISVNQPEANRVKIANDASKDADIDDLSVSAAAFGTPATVATGEAANIGKKQADLSGTLTDPGDQPTQELGAVWATHELPTVGDRKKAADGTAQGTFTVTASGLKPGTTYHYRAYATSNAGTVYGEDRTFTTEEAEPGEDTTDKIWCAPDGDDDTADGSEEYPFYSLDKAIALVEPGQRICMKAGTYVYDHRINIDDKNGTEEEPIELFAVDGRAVLDFSAMPYHKHSDNPLQGVRLTSSYWHLYRIDICNASDNGLLIERNKPAGGSNDDILNATEQAHDNIIEECNFYRNGDTGLQIKNLGAFNYIINCDSYLNCDEDEGDADGFAPKISVGDGNYFYGCRAWLNSDDGWDVFFKKDGGFSDNVSIILENCVAYKNGFLTLDNIAPDGNGNGFKCGSNQGAMNVYMNRCLAVCNKAKGFDQNHNAGDIIMNNCTGMTLKSIGDKSYSYRIYEEIASGHEVRLTNCIAINDNDATDKRDKNGDVKPSEHGKQGEYGRFEVDETLPGLTVTTCEFQKADPTQFLNIGNHEELIGERQADGSLPETTFAHLTASSFLIDAGTLVDDTDYRGISVAGISYTGKAPDLGAYETAGSSTNGVTRLEHNVSQQGLQLRQTQGGAVLLTVGGGLDAKQLHVQLYNAAGQLLGQHRFAGATTAMALPAAARGTVVLRVTDAQERTAVCKANVR